MNPKIPPHDLEAEQSLLSAVLIDDEAIIKVSDHLKPESFYKRNHQLIYESMVQLYESREAIDVVTLTNQLKKNKALTKVGGASAIAKLSNLVSTGANAEVMPG